MKNMKYKVLAADDEFWSRENIRNLILWEEYSLEFLEPACANISSRGLTMC